MGKRLNSVPFENGFELETGRKKRSPQIPPHTILGYNQPGVSAGEIATPKDRVSPISPKNQTVTLFANAPKQPAEKKINNVFIIRVPFFISKVLIALVARSRGLE